jgi:hypothetical protein
VSPGRRVGGVSPAVIAQAAGPVLRRHPQQPSEDGSPRPTSAMAVHPRSSTAAGMATPPRGTRGTSDTPAAGIAAAGGSDGVRRSKSTTPSKRLRHKVAAVASVYGGGGAPPATPVRGPELLTRAQRRVLWP